MKSAKNQASGVRTRTKTTADSPAAARASPDSAERSGGRRGSRRRLQPAVTSADSGDSPSGSWRVLRARRAGPGEKSPTEVQRGRGRAAKSRGRNASAVQTKTKIPAANQSSKQTPGPKLSKGRRAKRARPPKSSSSTPATSCKREEAEAAASTTGEDAHDAKRTNDNVAEADMVVKEDPLLPDENKDLVLKPETKMEKSKRRAKSQQKEVKKEESDKEEDEKIKKEDIAQLVVHSEAKVGDHTEANRKRSRQDDKAPRPPKRRKKPPVQYVRCEMEGCGTVLAHPRYLQHHIKYQHLLKKKYVCDHPSCGRLFRLQKQLLRHAKHHTDQRDYICEYCARAFKSSHNLAVHRMIHTGEKPIQCEICGFTCRQKASLNWHMKKHDAEASYQFSCSICGKKFEKKDSVVAHKAKSHPEVLIAEAMAANGGSVISTPVLESAPPVVTEPEQPSASQEGGEQQLAAGGGLTPLHQVVLSLAPQTDAPQGLFLQLPTSNVAQGPHQQQAPPTLLHLTPAPPAHLSSSSHPQLIQLSTPPTSTGTCTDSQSTLLTLTSVAPPPAAHWERRADGDEPVPGEGELWDRVVVGEGTRDVGEMMWEGDGERRKGNDGIVWEREGERQILLRCSEVPGDSLL